MTVKTIVYFSTTSVYSDININFKCSINNNKPKFYIRKTRVFIYLIMPKIFRPYGHHQAHKHKRIGYNMGRNITDRRPSISLRHNLLN